MKSRILVAAAALLTLNAGAFELTKTIGWNECVAAEWAPVAGAYGYEVFYSTPSDNTPIKVDNNLLRYYPEYIRVDVPGLPAGSYTLTINALGLDANPIDLGVATIEAHPIIREGFAFSDGYVPGAYNDDGSPKDGAVIIYVDAKNANTVTVGVVTDGKGKVTESAGLCNILKARGKGYDKTPLIIRIIGCISSDDISGLKSGNYIEFTGANTDKRRIENITIEGVGNDASLKGFGVFTKRSRGIEVRNLGIMLFGDDGISMEADNNNNWVHHCDFFYGKPGKDKDQVKGDGTIDMKYQTTDITIDHNHFFDCGKTTFAGGATESGIIRFTYHHNWFDHADSRCPRLCHATAHIYNNYFDANKTMCLLSTEDTSAFMEANYFRNCPSPMEINMQGTNRKRWPDGEQNGGMNKSYNNLYEGPYELITQHDSPDDFDAYDVDDRNERVPSTIASLKGGNTYSNFDTEPSMYAYIPDASVDVPEKVKQTAGRMEGGDIKWHFNNATDDDSTEIDPDLKALITDYTDKLTEPYVTGIELINMDSTPAEGQLFDLWGRSCKNPANGVFLMRQGNKAVKVLK